MAAALVLLVTMVTAVAVSTAPAAASSRPTLISFTKYWVDEGHYVGTTSDGGTIEMWVSGRTNQGALA